MGKNSSGAKINKKCYKCSLNCTVSRSIAIGAEKVPESERKAFLERIYGSGEPVYNPQNCKKRK